MRAKTTRSNKYLTLTFHSSMDLNSQQITVFAFSNDTAVIAIDKNSAIALIKSLSNELEKVGMLMNPNKSVTINIQNRTLVSEKLIITDGAEIHSIAPEEKLRYLRVNF